MMLNAHTREFISIFMRMFREAPPAWSRRHCHGLHMAIFISRWLEALARTPPIQKQNMSTGA